MQIDDSILKYYLRNVLFITGMAAVDNPASCRVLERCGFARVDTRELLVHITGQRAAFAVYRYTF